MNKKITLVRYYHKQSCTMVPHLRSYSEVVTPAHEIINGDFLTDLCYDV